MKDVEELMGKGRGAKRQPRSQAAGFTVSISRVSFRARAGSVFMKDISM